MVEMDPSASIDPKLDEIGYRHLGLTEKLKDKLGYNFFRMKKNCTVVRAERVEISLYCKGN
jgi:hypothetical protein